jgi:regulator of replication initiation timing
MEQTSWEKKMALLERRVKLLVQEHQALRQENSQLRAENQSLRSLLKSKDEQLENYRNSVNIDKLVHASPVTEAESVELKGKISDYLKKIDLCIAYLSE